MDWGYKFERGKLVFDEFVNDLYKDKKDSSNPVLRKIAKYSLNSLYGKFGQKDITSTMKIVKRDELKNIIKNYNYQYISEIDSEYSIIKYSSRLNETLRKMYKDELKKIGDMSEGLYKSNKRFFQKGIPSAVHIASAISAYARMSINKFKNIPGNTCYYSDTDSVILAKRLPDALIGKDLGQMKLEHHIRRGIIIRNKLYALHTYDGNTIIKSSGVNSKSLQYSDFEKLLNGESIEIKTRAFMIGWKDLKINIAERTVKLKGLELKGNDHDKVKMKSDKMIENDKLIINTHTITSNEDNYEEINEENNFTHKKKDESIKSNSSKVTCIRKYRRDKKGDIGKRKFSTSIRILRRRDNDDDNIKIIENSQSNPFTNDKSKSMMDEEIRNGEEDKKEGAILRYDGSKRESILSRKNGIYKIYNNIFLNDRELFIRNMTDILEDLYDNNSFTIFKLFFLLSIENKDLPIFYKLNIVDLNNHLSQYDPYILNENITRVYKNTGLILGVNVLV